MWRKVSVCQEGIFFFLLLLLTNQKIFSVRPESQVWATAYPYRWSSLNLLWGRFQRVIFYNTQTLCYSRFYWLMATLRVARFSLVPLAPNCQSWPGAIGTWNLKHFLPGLFAEVSWWTVLCGIHRVSWRLCARHCYYAGKWCEDVSPRGRWQLSHFLRRGSEFTWDGGTPALNETRSPFISGLPSYMNAKHPWLYDLGIKQILNTLNEYSYKIQAWFQSLHS